MDSNVAQGTSPGGLRRATHADLRAAEELVACGCRRMAATVLGVWEEPMPIVGTVEEPAAAGAPTPPTAGGHGGQLHERVVGHVQLHGAA